MQLLKLLADGKFHSGQELGEILNISRAAIWKQLNKLELETGIQVQRVQGKGYQLESCLSLLEDEAIAKEFKQWPTQVISTTDSTNTECLRQLSQGATPPLAITAEQQTNGRGRRGRQWVSPYGQNLYYSLLITIKDGLKQLEALSLTAGLALLKTLKELGITDAGLKWPNDILVNNKKISGILLELNGDPADICHVVIGVGVNVNMLKTAEEITQPWSSIRQETGQFINRNQLTARLSNSLAHYLSIHLQEGFNNQLKNEWEAQNLWQGKRVTLLQGDQQISGTMLGISETGALKLKIGNETQYFNAGEVSLRLAP